MLLSRVRRTIRERGLLRVGDKVLLGVSGGPDSMAMLDVLHRLGPELSLSVEVASVDHGLRPAARDELDLVRAAASARGLPFHAITLELAGGSAIQARARAARYAALLATAKVIGARRVAVGHTLDDQAETVLARLLRGSGPRGLAGIAPKRRDGVVRPLIDARREEVQRWNAAHGIDPAQDPSNLDRRYTRVRLRTEVLPVLTRESPSAALHLAHLADDCRALAALARHEARQLTGGQSDLRAMPVEPLARAAGAVRAEALRAWTRALTGREAKRAHLDALERTLQGRGTALLPDGWLVERRGDWLHAHARAAETASDRVEQEGERFDPNEER